MEYMEGGALTDIIENNTLEEDQISSISLEVSLDPNCGAVLQLFYPGLSLFAKSHTYPIV
jgi:hypothetical protein